MDQPASTEQMGNACLEQIETITPEALQAALRCWRQGWPAPEPLLSLALLDARDGEGPLARDVLLYDWVAETVRQQIVFYAPGCAERLANTPPDQASQLALFKHLMHQVTGTESSGGAMWTVLYFRWVIPETPPPTELAAAANISSRHLSRLVKYGLHRLAHRLRQAAFYTCRQRRTP